MNEMTTNNAGGDAFKSNPKTALARFASTGCLSSTFYADSNDQLNDLLALLKQVEPKFIAQVAVYARQNGNMKDMPAAILAYLSTVDGPLTEKVFNKVIDNPKMLKNFVKFVRSGQFGRKSFGSRLKRVMQNWLNNKTDDQLFIGSIGNDPSLADVIKLVHPKPADETRKALYGYLIGAMTDKEFNEFVVKEGNADKKNSHYNQDNLPKLIKDYEQFKQAPNGMLLPPNLSFEMLTAMPLTKEQWVEIAKNATWNQTKKNLNTFQRHGVFEAEGMIGLIAERLGNADLIKKSKVMPFELLAAYLNISADMPASIKTALELAMERATSNAPAFEGNVKVCLDVSGSMSNSVTGNKVNKDGKPLPPSKVRCIDAAALFAACMMRKNENVEVIPFEGHVVDIKRADVKVGDPIMEIARKLASIGGGSTNCAAPLEKLNSKDEKASLVVYVSDNESHGGRYNTGSSAAWKKFKSNNPNARLVCIDITPSTTQQVESYEDVLSVGGFSDSVFDVVSAFYQHGFESDFWVKEIEKIEV